MTTNDHTGGQTLLDQFTATYLRSRWYIGSGMVAFSLIAFLLGVGYTWIVAAAGLVILAHAFATAIWEVHEPISALVVDLTVGNVAVLVFANANRDHTAALLTLVTASVLIVLFSDGWRRAALVAYATAFTLVTILSAVGWRSPAVVGDALGLTFVLAMIIGVVSAIRRRLTELEAARAQTISVVSHELRNHMAGVIGVTELVSDPESYFDPHELKELLQLVHQQAVEAGDVIEDLLTASRSEQGVLDVVIEPVDLCYEAEVVLRRFGVEDREIPLECPDGPVWAKADPHRFRQVLRNLVTNAVRYGGPNVAVSIVRVGPIGSVVISDDGDGVHPVDEASIFLPYRRSRDKAPAPGSTGLGLWIARSLARQMGGDLTYQRRRGQTVFDVTLPVVDPSASEQADVLATSSFGG
ncbi:MAG TPA: ATP-binding protein [Acidimicrobiia bacterium]|nr:ATP-binding protein [Acidimicrobiia bacterium]